MPHLGGPLDLGRRDITKSKVPDRAVIAMLGGEQGFPELTNCCLRFCNGTDGVSIPRLRRIVRFIGPLTTRSLDSPTDKFGCLARFRRLNGRACGGLFLRDKTERNGLFCDVVDILRADQGGGEMAGQSLSNCYRTESRSSESRVPDFGQAPLGRLRSGVGERAQIPRDVIQALNILARSFPWGV
jgi:hypothetical protein